jgi:hypothetical protein
MNLQGLLDELRGNVLRDDAELASGPDDRLWSDETLVRYVNDAQTLFARRTLSLRDASTPEVTQVTLVAGVSLYELHPSVLCVLSARPSDTAYDLSRVGRSLLSTLVPTSQPYFDSNAVEGWTPGRPRAFATDETLSIDSAGAVTLQVWPTPSADEEGLVLNLRVARLPLVEFTVNKPKDECELPSEHQLDMLEWAAFRALRNSDIDGHSDAASKHEKRFDDAVKEVLKDLRRKMFAPMAWQFGGNGFSWES